MEGRRIATMMTRQQFDEAVYDALGIYINQFRAIEVGHSCNRKVIDGKPASATRWKWEVVCYPANQFCTCIIADGQTPDEALYELQEAIAREFPKPWPAATDAEQYAAAESAGGL
jgi:hypothetical protein